MSRSSTESGAPWEAKHFWGALMTVSAAAATLIGALWAAAQSPWVEKPARESQLTRIQDDVAGLRKRVDKNNDRTDRMENAINSMAQNMATMTEAQKRTSRQVEAVSGQINDLSMTLIRRSADGEHSREGK